MYKMNGWKREKRGDSQADTYIERHFEEACELLNDGCFILNEWRDRKSNYISYTSATVFDFQHYSRHDASHSVNILEAIELILGQNRIKRLSAGDLWLILEAAYFHDIGMSLTYKDLKELWQDKDFQEFARNGLKEADADSRDAKNWYIQADNLLNGKRKMEGVENEKEVKFEITWPVELERRLLFLVSDYIRRDHAKRSLKYLSRFDCPKDTRIPRRLYLLVAEISRAHGESDFENIINELEYEAKGFGIDVVHPRFVASLLRLGDLMDMDNNRFNMRAIEHYGKLPETSALHLKKHMSMTHILISPRKISATASSEELDVCKVTSNWFEYIRDEVKNLICYWSEMAPKNLNGCIMQKADCVVYYPHKPIVFNAKHQRGFEVDKAKLTDLLIGTNIYDVKLDFLREYLQNALDATKMQIWMELKDQEHWEWKNPQIENLMDISPLDISQKVYEDYAIEVRIIMDENNQQVILEVFDHGIGMEEGCINAISKIGAGWRERKEYNSEIPKMPKWLRPTGGFGIGIQSAFMVTDTVEICTKADSESQAHKITLTSPRTTGMITMESGYQNFQRGTSVKVKVDYKYFQEWNRFCKEDERIIGEAKEKGSVGRQNSVQKLIGEIQFAFESSKDKVRDMDIFDADNNLEYVLTFLERYIRNIAANSVIPIKLICKGKITRTIYSPFLPINNYWKEVPKTIVFNSKNILIWNNYEEVVIELQGQKYRCIYDIVNDWMFVWNCNESVFTYFHRNRESSSISRGVTTCFKNICVVRNTDISIPYVQNFTVCIDFMGHSAEAALKVHRNSFNDEFQLRKYLETAMRAYLKCLLRFMEIKEDQEESDEANRKQLLKINAQNNLFHYPIPIICELFFKDLNLLSKYKAKDDEKISLFYIKIDEIKDDEGKTTGIVMQEVFRAVSIQEFLPVLQDFFNKKDTDNGPVLFVKEHVSEEWKVEQSRFAENSIVDWFNRKNMEADDKRIVLNHDCWQVLDQLKACNMYLLADTDLIEKIIESGKFKKSYFILSGKNESGKDVQCSVTRIEWKYEENQKVLDEEIFYKKSFAGPRIGERFIAGNVESGYYPKLQVRYLPYDKEMAVSGPYLISPISAKLKSNIDIILRTRNSLADISYSDFEEMVVNYSGYQALVNWVYNNQLEPRKYKSEEIDKNYRDYIKEIYERNK